MHSSEEKTKNMKNYRPSMGLSRVRIFIAFLSFFANTISETHKDRPNKKVYIQIEKKYKNLLKPNVSNDHF